MKRNLSLATAIVGLALALPSGATAAPFVYVVNANTADVSQYDAGMAGLLAPLSPPTVDEGGFPLGVAVSPDARSVYVTNTGRGSVSQYDIGADGALSPKVPAQVSAGGGPVGVAVSPDGSSVYVVSGLVFQYDVGAAGTLSPKNPATVPATGTAPGYGIAVSPDGSSVYVTNLGSDDVSQYDVGGDGTLSPKVPATVAAGGSPIGVAVNPDGRSAYVTNYGGTVSQFDVGAGGALSAKSPASVATVAGSFWVAVNPDGRSVYVANNVGDGTVSPVRRWRRRGAFPHEPGYGRRRSQPARGGRELRRPKRLRDQLRPRNGRHARHSVPVRRECGRRTLAKEPGASERGQRPGRRRDESGGSCPHDQRRLQERRLAGLPRFQEPGSVRRFDPAGAEVVSRVAHLADDPHALLQHRLSPRASRPSEPRWKGDPARSSGSS